MCTFSAYVKIAFNKATRQTDIYAFNSEIKRCIAVGVGGAREGVSGDGWMKDEEEEKSKGGGEGRGMSTVTIYLCGSTAR